jgi:hypothetical protein
MLPAEQFILVWDIATTTFFSKIHKKIQLFGISFEPVGQKFVKRQKKNLPLYRQEVPEIILA